MRRTQRGVFNDGSPSLNVAKPPDRMAKADLRYQKVPADCVMSISMLKERPEAAASLSPQLIPALVAALASEQATLSALQAVLSARLLSAREETQRDDTEDRLLRADEVAAVLGVPKRWVQRRARRLPFARLISDHAVRYSAAGLKRWLEHRRASVA
jgi:predicted DNA-binding transcriptional regulator AlpA